MLTNGKLQANRLKIGEKRLVLKVHKMFSIARVNIHLHGSRFINNGFECKIVFFYLPICLKNMFWVLNITISLRQFFCMIWLINEKINFQLLSIIRRLALTCLFFVNKYLASSAMYCLSVSVAPGFPRADSHVFDKRNTCL